MTINVQPSNSALARSPILYRVNDVITTHDIAIADVYIWRGDKTSDKPVSYNHRLKKKIVNEGCIFNISKLVSDFLSQPDPSGYINAIFEPSTTEACWVSVEFGWITTAGVIVEADVTSTTIIAVNGYSSTNEGVNVQVPDLLTSVTVQNINTENTFIVAVGYINGNTVDKLKFTSDDGTTYTQTISADKTQSEENILYFDFSPSVYAGDYVSQYTIQALDSSLVVLGTITVNVEQACKFEPLSLAYVNRFGVWDYLAFNAKSTTDFSVTSSKYKNGNLGLSYAASALTYDDARPQTVTYNVQGKRTRTLNTFFLDEAVNVGIEEMLLSERHYLCEYAMPLKPIDNSFSKKTGLNDSLIQYTMKFEEAQNVINTIQ